MCIVLVEDLVSTVGASCRGIVGTRVKAVLPHTQLKNVLQMLRFGIVEIYLPLADGTAGDPRGGQAGLGQAKAGTQHEHGLPKGIVTLTIRVLRRRHTLCLRQDPEVPDQEWEVTGKQLAT